MEPPRPSRCIWRGEEMTNVTLAIAFGFGIVVGLVTGIYIMVI